MARLTSAVATLAAAALITGCGGLSAEDPGLALRQGAAATASLKTVTAAMKVTKGKISFQGFSLVSATAAVRLPDESDTTYTVKQQDLQIGLEVVILAGHVYLKAPFVGFSQLSAAQAAQIPDLAKLFDSTHGLPAVIPAGRNPTYVSADTVDGVDSHKVEVIYSADQVRGMLPQLNSLGDVKATIWVGGSDHLIRRAVLSGLFGDGGTDSSVEVDLSGFNSVVNITSPARTG
jgi:hypothetical protein